MHFNYLGWVSCFSSSWIPSGYTVRGSCCGWSLQHPLFIHTAEDIFVHNCDSSFQTVMYELLPFCFVLLFPAMDSRKRIIHWGHGKLTKTFINSKLHRIMASTAAKSLLSCPTLCDPIDGSPPGSPIPGISQARILEWVAISFSYLLSRSTHIVANSNIS